MRTSTTLVVLMAFLAGPNGLAADERGAAAPPTLDGHEFIERADGSVLVFYRTHHVSATDLKRHVSVLLRLKGLAAHTVEQQNVLVLEGDRAVVEKALAALPHFDAAPPQVRVVVSIERITRTSAEGTDERKAATKAELAAEAELTVTQGVQGVVSSADEEILPVVHETRTDAVVARTTTVRTRWAVTLLATHVGEDHVTLQAEPVFNGLREPTQMRSALPSPIQTAFETSTTVTIKYGQSAVIARMASDGAFEHEGAGPLTTTVPGASPRSARAGGTQTDIVVSITPYIVDPRAEGDPDAQDAKGEQRKETPVPDRDDDK